MPSWELVSQEDHIETKRLQVFGGWIIKVAQSGTNISMGTSFVPDVDHEWEL